MNRIPSSVVAVFACAWLAVTSQALALSTSLVAREALESSAGKAIVEKAMLNSEFAAGASKVLGISDLTHLLRNPEAMRSALLERLRDNPSPELNASAARILGLTPASSLKPALMAQATHSVNGLAPHKEGRSKTAKMGIAQTMRETQSETQTLVEALKDDMLERAKRGEVPYYLAKQSLQFLVQHPDWVGKGLLKDCGKLSPGQATNLARLEIAMTPATTERQGAQLLWDEYLKIRKPLYPNRTDAEHKEDLQKLCAPCDYFKPTLCAIR